MLQLRSSPAKLSPSSPFVAGGKAGEGKGGREEADFSYLRCFESNEIFLREIVEMYIYPNYTGFSVFIWYKMLSSRSNDRFGLYDYFSDLHISRWYPNLWILMTIPFYVTGRYQCFLRNFSKEYDCAHFFRWFSITRDLLIAQIICLNTWNHEL